MIRYFILMSILCTGPAALADSWTPVENTMLTPWGREVSPDNAWREYPRPQLVRPSWQNLNGLWHYRILPRGEARPTVWNGEILVPFAVETPLSGVGKRLRDDEAIWYHKRFDLSLPRTGRMLLHFEAVDYECRVWVNDAFAGSHRGGNLPFSFDITALVKDGSNEIVLRAIDDTDAFDHYQLRGKQQRENRGIWYTPSSGIWQTVWLEQVPAGFIEALFMQADMEGKLVADLVTAGDVPNDQRARLTLLDGSRVLGRAEAQGTRLALSVPGIKLWSPDQPKLFAVTVELLDGAGNLLDRVESYTGFRTVGKVRDGEGHWRFTLNGKTIFHLGPLDQGWWPDGFLNPPADAAVVHEMEYLKAAGFNMIRKHKKVEPRRYYYHADRLGFLVWQDHVSGGAGPNEWPQWKKLMAYRPDHEPRNARHWRPGDRVESDWPDWAHTQFMTELRTMIDGLYNHPCIVVWTTFNERWGQHRTMEVGNFVKTRDPSRHLNIASGGNFFPIGDIADEHNYPHPDYPVEIPIFADYLKVVGEFGGHGWLVEGHQWDPSKETKIYGNMPQTLEEFRDRYIESMRLLGELKARGVAAGVYTQTTDVEGEINGLMTYNREVHKLSAEDLRAIHARFRLVQP